MAEYSSILSQDLDSYLTEIIHKSCEYLIRTCLKSFQDLPLSRGILDVIHLELLNQAKQIVLPTLLIKTRLWRQERAIQPGAAVGAPLLHSFPSDPHLDALAQARIRARAAYIHQAITRLLRDSLSSQSAQSLVARPTITAIEFTRGETHNGCRSPVLFELDHQKVFYKPVSASPYQLIHMILAELIPELCSVFAMVHPLDLYSHTACFYEHSYTQDIERYDQRFGALCAVAWMLRISDLHFENIVAIAEGPVAIDLEVIAHCYGPEHHVNWTGLVGDTVLSAFAGGVALWRTSVEAEV